MEMTDFVLAWIPGLRCAPPGMTAKNYRLGDINQLQLLIFLDEGICM